MFGRAPVAAGLVVLSAIPSRLSPESVPIDKSPVDLEAEAAKPAAHPRGKPRFSTYESGLGREKDSPLEREGFELSREEVASTHGGEGAEGRSG